LRSGLVGQFDPEAYDGIISMHLLENDAALSKPLTDAPDAPSPGAADWTVLVDGTSPQAVEAAIAGRFDGAVATAGAKLICSGIYRLLWDLAKADIAF
jgi:hypothetical protein